MLTRTVTTEIYNKAKTQKLVDHGEDLVVMSAHGSTCPLCAPWEGKVVSISGKTKGYPSMAEAREVGMLHPNCRHMFNLWIEEHPSPDSGTTVDKPKPGKNNKDGQKQQKEIKKLDLDSLKLDRMAKGTSKETHEEYLNVIKDCNNEDIQRLYLKYADSVSHVTETADDGYFLESAAEIKWSLAPDCVVVNGDSKFQVIAHEYGHCFDTYANASKLTFNEMEKVRKTLNLKHVRYHFKMLPSSCDEFLAALRKDKEILKANIGEIRSSIRANRDSMLGVQDTISGFWGNKKGGTAWGHEEAYWDDNFNAFVKDKYSSEATRNNKDGLKQVYADLGINIENDSALKQEVRIYENASETWANITSAVTTGAETIEHIKKYLPNTYQAYLDILKKIG